MGCPTNNQSVISGCPTDIHQRYRTLRHLDPGMGLNLEVFPQSKESWFVRCISYLHVLWSEHEDNHALKATWRMQITSAFALLLRVWSAKTRRPPN